MCEGREKSRHGKGGCGYSRKGLNSQAGKFAFNSVGNRELGEVWVPGRSICQVGRGWNVWVRVRKRRDLLQNLITMQVNGLRTLTKATKSEEGQARRSLGHQTHRSDLEQQ